MTRVPAVSIAVECPTGSDHLALLAASDAYLRTRYDPVHCYLLDRTALQQPHVTFFVARIAGAAVGCAALVRSDDDYGELKRMFVMEEARRTGIGRRLLAVVETEARRDLASLRLETGIRQPESLALYRAAGFRPCPPFADYTDNGVSVFMEKRLHPLVCPPTA